MKKLGIENAKILVSFSITLALIIIQLDERKGLWAKVSAFFKIVPDIRDVIDKADEAVEEFEDLDQEEKVEMEVFLQQKFNLQNERAQRITHAAIATGLSLFTLVMALKSEKRAA